MKIYIGSKFAKTDLDSKTEIWIEFTIYNCIQYISDITFFGEESKEMLNCFERAETNIYKPNKLKLTIVYPELGFICLCPNRHA